MTEPISILVHWICERENVRLRKESGAPRPWTTDPIIHEWRFCNVDRNQDRETKWIFDNVITPHDTSPVLWFNLVIARMINWSPALVKIGYFDDWYPLQFIGTIERMQQAEEKVYTGAYMIPAGPTGMAKHRWLAQTLFSSLWERRVVPQTWWSCAAWAEFLQSANGLGPFLANQIVTDMKYSHHLMHAEDWDTFILAGPGTMRGMNRLSGRPLAYKWDQAEARRFLIELRVLLASWPQLKWAEEVFIDLNNLANVMCETDKFCRVLYGEGTPRARYNPHGGKA